MASKKLVQLARKAAAASAKSAALNRAWVEAFKAEFGHDDISDALIEVIDYSTGDISLLTAEFIEKHSGPGRS